MNELTGLLNQTVKITADFIQSWGILMGAFVGSALLGVTKIWPWIKSLWEAQKKIKDLEDEKRCLDLRKTVLIKDEELFLVKKNLARLEEQLMIKENVIWKEGMLYYNDTEICSRCYDTSPSSDRKTVRLLCSTHKIKGNFYCPECNIHPRTKEAADEELRMHQEISRQHRRPFN